MIIETAMLAAAHGLGVMRTDQEGVRRGDAAKAQHRESNAER